MQPEEFYLTFDGQLSRYFCPFILPWASVYQSIMLISLLYKQSLHLKGVMDLAGHKMNEHAIEAFRNEINRSHMDIVRLKAGIEN